MDVSKVEDFKSSEWTEIGVIDIGIIVSKLVIMNGLIISGV